MTTPQQGSCSTRPPVGCGGACMSAVALLATVVQRIRIAYSSIRIEITYPHILVTGVVVSGAHGASSGSRDDKALPRHGQVE